MSNFAFLQAEWPLLHESAARAESLAHTDARAACFYARRTLELAVAWLYKHDRALRLPYQDNLSALIHEPTFARVVGEAVFTKTKVIKDLGNQAVQSTRKVLPADAVVATRELFHIGYWLARTYGQRGRPDPGLAFNLGLLAKPAAAAPAVPPRPSLPPQHRPCHRRPRTSCRSCRRSSPSAMKGSPRCWAPRRCWMPNWPGCASRWPPPSGSTPPHPTRTTIQKRKPATTSSTCC